MTQTWKPQPLDIDRPLIERVHEALLEAICDGLLPPGTRLTQESLADLLGVSRQPITQALVLLKQQGFAREASGRGLEVAPVEPDRFRALFQVRAALDALAAGAAAGQVARNRNACGPLLARLQEILSAGKGAAARADRTALVRLDMAFHAAVAELSGNPVVVEITHQQWTHIRRGIAVALEDPAFHTRCWNEHAAMSAAIAAGQVGEAETLARAHCEAAGRETWQRLVEQGAGAAATEEV